MTKLNEHLDRIKALHEAATEGPWFAESFEVHCEGLKSAPCDGGCPVCEGEGYLVANRLETKDGEIISDVGARAAQDHGIGPYIQVYGLETFAANDAAFIADSRTSVPWMAQVIRAQARVIEAQKALLVFDENNYNEQMRYGTLLVESEEAKSALAKLLESEWS